jgi:hypothetical protein
MGDFLAAALALSADRSPAAVGGSRRRRGPKRLRLTDNQRIDIAIAYADEMARAEKRIAFYEANPTGPLRSEAETARRLTDIRGRVAGCRAIVLAVELSDGQAESVMARARARVAEEPL